MFMAKFLAKPGNIHYKTTVVDNKALGGKATRKEITIYFTKGDDGPSMVVLL